MKRFCDSKKKKKEFHKKSVIVLSGLNLKDGLYLLDQIFYGDNL
jgi:hypothetical protein